MVNKSELLTTAFALVSRDVARTWLVAMIVAFAAPLDVAAAWTAAGQGLEALNVSGRPTLLALPGTGSNLAPAAPRVLVVAEESPEGLRFVDPDAGTELGVLSLVGLPVALAVNSAGTRAYVLTDNDRLHVVDIAARALLSTFTLGGGPRAVLVRESGGQVAEVLVAQKGPDRVVGIDPATGATLRSLDLDRDPATLAWGLGGTRVLAGARNGKLYTLDAANFEILATAQLGDEIRHVSWWEAGGLAVAVHKHADGVSLVNIGTGQVSAFVALDGDPEHGAVDAGLARLYVTTHDDFSVNRLNLTSRSLDGRYVLPEKAAGSLFDAATEKLIVSQRGDQRLLRLDPAQANLISVLQLNKRLRDIAINNTTHEAVAVADKADELTRIKLSDRSAATVVLPARPRFVAVDTALNLAVVGLKNKQVRFVNLAPGTGPMLLADTVTLADEPDALAIDSTRNLTIALTDSKRTIHFVSNTARALLSSISVNEDTVAAAIHAGRGLAYVLADKKLLLIGLDSRAVVQTIGLEFRGNAIAVSEGLDRAVITTDQDNKAYVLDLTTVTAGTTSLVESGFAQVHVLPRKPGAIALQADTNVAVITSGESDTLSALDLTTGTLAAGFVTLEKPFALAITSRYNQALVLSAERDDVAFVQLANPVPALETIAPNQASTGSPAIVLALTGGRFIESSRAFFGSVALTTRWVSHTQLEADVPATLLTTGGTVNITVQNPPPAGGTSNALVFTIGGGPVLTAIQPDTAPADGQPKVLSLTGQNFANGATVLFGAATLPVTFNSSTSLNVTVPGTLTQAPGQVQMAVVNPNGQASSALLFTLTVFVPPVSIALASPADGTSIAADSVLVSGTFQGPPNTGVTVNGVIAAIDGSNFYAQVPLQPGTNSLTTVMTSPDGFTVTRSITVTSTGPAPISVTVSPVYGVAPFKATFGLGNTTGRAIKQIQADYNGDGVLDLNTTDPSAVLGFNYTTPGLYTARFTVLDDQNTSYTVSAIVQAEDPQRLDQTLRATWNGFTQALVARDKTAAMKFLNASAQTRYGRVFDALLASLPTVAGSVSAPERSKLTGSIGEYFVRRQAADGTTRLFLIYFVRDVDGVWRLDTM
jgi:IPT/TIG domain-containing protein/glucodextranase-like protein